MKITTIDANRIDAFAGIWIPWLRDTMGRHPVVSQVVV